MNKYIIKVKRNLDERFTNYYRYPFKLVLRPRRLLSNIYYPEKRYSPPGFNSTDSTTQYDLYLEPDSIKKLSRAFSIVISLLFLILCSVIVDSSEASFFESENFVCIAGPSILFFVLYYMMTKSVFFYYHASYPVFADSWSEKMDAYSEWFSKIPQEIIIKEKNKDHDTFESLNNKKKRVKLERQPLYYAWNAGSAQKSMWLLAIENMIDAWEKKGIFKENTSFFVFLSPIWSSYLSLLIILFLSGKFYPLLVKNLYVMLIAWLLCSIVYLLFIYFFIAERKINETQKDINVKRLIPYELRAIINKNNNLYENFKKKHFLSVVHLLFSVMVAFYIVLIGLVK